MWRHVCVLIAIAVSVGLCLAGEDGDKPAARVVLREDAPAKAPAANGEIRLTIPVSANYGGVKDMHAVSRVTGKAYTSASHDAAKGLFVFKALPRDARYDICFNAAASRRIEGVDLDFVDHRLIKLAAQRRKTLKLPPERKHGFSAKDVEALKQYVREMDEFMEQRRVLYVKGHGRRATLLVELMRTRPFHASEGNEVVWRVELWYFANQFGGWDKLANQERVLRRVRTSAKEWAQTSVEYYPQLSVYVPSAGAAAEVKFTLPAKPDPSRGRVAQTAADINTETHVLGLDEKKSGHDKAKTTSKPKDAGHGSK